MLKKLSEAQKSKFLTVITKHNREQLHTWLPIVALYLFGFGFIMQMWIPKSALLNSLEDIQEFRFYLLYTAPIFCLLTWFIIARLPLKNIYNILCLFLIACVLALFHATLMSHSFTLAPVSIIIITALAKVTILRKREIIVIYGCSILCGYLFVMYTHKHTEILSHHLLISNLMIISWLLYLGQDHYTTQLRNFTHNQQQRKAKQKITMQMMQLEAQKVQLQVLLGRDAMTGLYNRGYFDHQLLEEINRASRAHSPLGLLVIDVDHFKVVNDKLGHHIGDEYLKTLATTLDQTCRRETDTVARFGGEEFVILLPNTSHSGLISISQSLLQAVSDLNLPHPIQPKVSISIGGCEFDPDTMNRLTFFEKADQALYKVKTSGRDGFSIPPL